MDYHFKSLLVSDFAVKQNRQTFILIPSFKSYKDLTHFISNRTVLSGQRWFVLSVHKGKWRLSFQMLKCKIHADVGTCKLPNEEKPLLLSEQLFIPLSKLVCSTHVGSTMCELYQHNFISCQWVPEKKKYEWILTHLLYLTTVSSEGFDAVSRVHWTGYMSLQAASIICMWGGVGLFISLELDP